MAGFNDIMNPTYPIDPPESWSTAIGLTMRRPGAASLLWSCLWLCPSVAGACPSGHDRVVVGDELAAISLEQAGPKAVDYVSFLPTPGDPASCFILVSLAGPSDCPYCRATIDIFELKRVHEQWAQAFMQRAALNLGEWGKAPKATLLNMNGPMFRFEQPGMHRGHADNVLVLAAKVDGRFKVVLELKTKDDNSAVDGERPWRWSAETSFITKKNAFPDIQATFSWTEESGDAIRVVRRTQLYAFKGGGYKPVGPQVTHTGRR